MKKQLIFGSLFAFAGIANAQWSGTNPLTTLSNVGIGTTSPGMPLQVIAAPTSQDGVLIKQASTASYAQGAALHLDNYANTSVGGKRYSLISTGPGDAGGAGNFLIYDWFDGNYRFSLQGTTGNIAIGMLTPAYKLDILANNYADDGIKITQTSAGYRSGLYLNNTAGTGKNWGLTSGPGGHFNVRNETSGTDLMDLDFNGHLGLGANSNASAQLFISSTSEGIYSGSFNAGNAVGVEGVAQTSGGNTNAALGLKGTAAGGGEAFGVRGYAFGAKTSYGGYFSAAGYAPCTPGIQSIGVYGAVLAPCTGDYAGLFDGDVNVNGVLTVYGVPVVSDRKLKKDIKVFANGLEKIKLLKPSTYTFRTDEFKSMNLPSGSQLGLIAQEVEEIFPELVMDVAGHDQLDKDNKVTNTVASHKAVNYIGLIPVLIAGVQEQQAQIESQQKTIDQQTAINADLQKQLDDQKQLIISMKVSGTTGINTIGGVETGFQMSQNEPNPFTHETVVKYTLPQTVNTAYMAVYDLTGKQITTFLIQEKGSSSLTITSENLSAGIYIYSIVADGKVLDSKRMIVAGK